MNLNKSIFTILIFSLLTSCKVGRFVIYNFADIKDYKKFPNREIQNKSNTTFNFTSSNEDLDLNLIKNDFDEYARKNKTVAFLVIQNDTIKYEKYYNKYNETSIVPSFSMAKSFTSILIGCAIDDELITSIKEPITNYIPELKKNNFEKVTIEHLLQMTSGLDFNESYLNPFGHAASFYYGRNLRKETSKLKLKNKPGKECEYVSGNTQLLGLVLERALKDKTISKYFEEKIWTPLQMEYDASWSIDKKKNGIEKTFCCVNARAKDFAKIGRLYLNKGNWNGNQIVSQKWVENSTKRDTLNGSAGNYQYQWWIPNKKGDFIAEGILGQFIFVSPSKNLIIVRLGKKYGDTNWEKLFDKIKEGL
ncbi:serine hydrolase domain-containing protein [Tenacibaculum finnmarkense]|uniref:serine hydrolase domain-containing protein n=1 Tax=Tenacibaculum finnmarkense TaxID=2781243 RepID=UPI001E4BA303|nr:serine hydrolase [Tenacibaculum finnmarkense]MCD8401408.1 beta-lactamase family protein [Tenacibaculum finnmarkense genomovar ulcerans]MCD8411055.1 beta-lactamase family protein [Tenacibaculum finnmarkense genomovar ulcerans]